MAPSKKKHKSKPGTQNSFAESIHKIAYRFSLHSVFEDFLTMSIAACTQNLNSGKSWYEDEYLATIAKYKDSELRHEFPNAFAALVREMEVRTGDQMGNDVLGEFFEQHISNGRNGQYFTPFPVCLLMASITGGENTVKEKPLRIIDPTCGSGRMLLASYKINGPENEYYGIDIDLTCVKMTALNLFLNGMWHSEVMCANALNPDDFVIAYRISLFPLGIFKIESKEQSKLWYLQKNSFTVSSKAKKSDTIVLDSTPFTERKKGRGTQLGLF